MSSFYIRHWKKANTPVKVAAVSGLSGLYVAAFVLAGHLGTKTAEYDLKNRNSDIEIESDILFCRDLP